MKRKGKSKPKPRKRKPGKNTRFWYGLIVIFGVLIIGTYSANALKWHCDDVFITLRYADNFLDGKGLVYNEGEYVEGYTHPLWLALLVLCLRLGFDSAASALNLGLASFVGVILLFSLISYKHNERFAFFVPVTALILIIHRDFLIWATGGLETMFFTFLLSLAFYLHFYSGIPERRRLIGVGLVLTLAILTRPDAVLIVALANICLLISRRSLSSLIWLNLPAVCILAPYLLWKYSYYGQLLPNPYYAKSGGSTYFSRGFFYVWLYLKPYFSSWLFFLALPAIFIPKRKVKSLIFAFVGVLVYVVLFVARVGGDFMYGRFLVLMIPFAIFAFEMAILQLWPGRKLLPAIAVAVVACSIISVEVPRRNEMLQSTKADMLGSDSSAPWFRSHKGIIDEHFNRTVVAPIGIDKARGELLEPYFRDLDATVVIRGRCCLGYYGKFKYIIEHYGLTDEYIAHLPIQNRGRVGHEKEGPLEYLEDRGADFLLGAKWPFGDRVRAFRGFALRGTGVMGYFITYDRDLVMTLKSRFGDSFECTDLESGLDQYIENQLQTADYQRLLRDYQDFRDVYFNHNDDKSREIAFQRRLRELEISQAAN